MLNTKSFLAVDFGAGNLKLAEFEVNEAGGLRLKQHAMRGLGPEGASSENPKREAAVLKALKDLMAEKGIKARDVNVTCPGFHVFTKFIKLPPVEGTKVAQMIQFEAQQNVPFPLNEVVWDYQILGTASSGEMEVLLVAIKAEIVEGIFRAVDDAGLRLQLADCSTAALCNAFRYNYGDLEDCTMLLDIGAKTSNVLFFEKGKVFARSINIGANSITQDFANDQKLPWAEAEKIKVNEGFVSLGGAYEEPDNPHQAAISKIARQFMTRLHIQVNQTMQFYRGQQGGTAPQRLFLCGGSSVMTYAAQFFAEKLTIPVEYFNPLRNVQIDPSINLEELARVAHTMGEVVGLGLRNLAHCPVELNLMPKSTKRWQTFNQKKPYIIATAFCLTLVVFAMAMLFGKLAEDKRQGLVKIEEQLTPLEQRTQRFKTETAKLQTVMQEADQVATWIHDRYYWADVLAELRRVLVTTEDKARRDLRTDVGLWVEKVYTASPSASPYQAGFAVAVEPGTEPPRGYLEEMTPDLFKRMVGLSGAGAEASAVAPPVITPQGGRGEYNPRFDRRRRSERVEVTPQQTDAQPADAAAAATGPVTNQLSVVMMVCRAVSLTPRAPSGNSDLAFAFRGELLQSPLTITNAGETDFIGEISPDEPNGTFTFNVKWKLKHPMKM
jgi:type IV pilus assembly protein PilM